MSSSPPIDPKDFYIHHQQNATIVRLPGSIHGLDLMIEDLDDCTVYILDHSAQITVDYCKNTRFVIGPVDGPFFIRNCENCTVSVACRQLRTRECVNTDFYLYCATKSPIIESSSNLRFHQFDISYPHLTQQFLAAKLDASVNHWDLIFDFSKDDATIPQPHSTVIKQTPPLISLRCFLDGTEVDGDCKDTPMKTNYPSSSEVRVEKITGSSPSPIEPTSTSPIVSSSPSAVAVMMESFGSTSVSSSPATIDSAESKSETAAAPVFEAGIAPTIPAFLEQKETADEPESTAVEAATSTSSSTVTSIETSAASVAVKVTPEVETVTVVKDASFSIHTSAEDATRALFELAGVKYEPPKPKPAPATVPVNDTTSTSATAATPSPPVDEEAALASWFSHTPGMISSSESLEATPLERVAEAEAARLAAIEERKHEAAQKAQMQRDATAASLKEFYAQRDAELAEQRKVGQTRSPKNSPHTHPCHNNTNGSHESIPTPFSSLSSSTAASSSTSSTSSSLFASLPASAQSFDASWNEVLSMLPASAQTRNNGTDLMRMKLLYMQLKAAKEKQALADVEEQKKKRALERKKKKKEKKKAKKAKRKAKKIAAITAALATATGQAATSDPTSSSATTAANLAAALDSSSSDSDSSSDSSSDEEEE